LERETYRVRFPIQEIKFTAGFHMNVFSVVSGFAKETTAGVYPTAINFYSNGFYISLFYQIGRNLITNSSSECFVWQPPGQGKIQNSPVEKIQ
jgi:hypothetical protein